MSGPVRRQSAPAATPREYPTASACHPWAWLPPFRFVASTPPIGSPSLDLPQTLPRLRGRTPPPQPHVQPVHASHANRASASWFSRIVISTRLAHPQAFEKPLRTPSDSIRPHYALGDLQWHQVELTTGRLHVRRTKRGNAERASNARRRNTRSAA